MRTIFSFLIIFIALISVIGCGSTGTDYVNQGDSLLAQGKWNEAVSQYSSAIEADPENAALYHSRAQAYIYLEKYDEALSDLNKAMELQPDYAETYNTRGYLYFLQHKDEEALEEE